MKEEVILFKDRRDLRVAPYNYDGRSIFLNSNRFHNLDVNWRDISYEDGLSLTKLSRLKWRYEGVSRDGFYPHFVLRLRTFFFWTKRVRGVLLKTHNILDREFLIPHQREKDSSKKRIEKAHSFVPPTTMRQHLEKGLPFIVKGDKTWIYAATESYHD